MKKCLSLILIFAMIMTSFICIFAETEQSDCSLTTPSSSKAFDCERLFNEFCVMTEGKTPEEVFLMSGQISNLYENLSDNKIEEENEACQEFLDYLETEGIAFDEWIQSSPEEIFDTLSTYEEITIEKETDNLLREWGMSRENLKSNTRGEIDDLINNIVAYVKQKGKATARATIRSMASGFTSLYPAATALLLYSLQDHPVKQYFYSPSLVCNAIQNHGDFINEYQYIFSLARGNGGAYTMNNQSMVLTRARGVDGYLAIKTFSFNARVWMVTNTNYMRMSFTVKDRYDFARENYSGGAINNLIIFINNVAYKAQQLGVIVPYDLVAYPAVPDTYR